MSKRISDEEYERVYARDKQVDDYRERFPVYMSHEAWCDRFKETAKPESKPPSQQYRPTLDELDRIFCDVIGYCPVPTHKAGLKAVIDKVYQGMQEEDSETRKGYYNISRSHRKGYKED